MWLLAIKAMLADRGKLVTSLLGVVFSVVLVNLQGGLLRGMIQKASLLVDFGQADIWVGHRHTTNVDMGSYIPERWIHRIRGIEGVERADPYVVMFGQVELSDGRFEKVCVVGSEPASLLGNAWIMEGRDDPRSIRDPNGVLADVYDSDRLGNCKIGSVFEINSHRAKVVGMTRGIVSFTTNPYIFTTLERARKTYGANSGVPPDQCSYYLVQAKPGADIADLCARIRERVPELDVHDRRSYSAICIKFWLTRTGIGISFGLAAFLGLLVGLAVVAQTLYASVTERIKEYGTLKAMGANESCVARFLLAQSLGNAMLGSLVGLFISLLIAHSMSPERAPRSPVVLHDPLPVPFVGVEVPYLIPIASVLFITVVCIIAAFLPYWRIRRIDPACVLRGF
jgi:putative ABC transport system permease protein